MPLAWRHPRRRAAAKKRALPYNRVTDLMHRLMPSVLTAEERASASELLWSLQPEAVAIERAERQIERLRAEVWEPFERCAHVLDRFGYLEFTGERVTERGRWLADLRVDRPLLVGEALQRGLFAGLDAPRAAALIAARVAYEDRDYGELELYDAIVSLLFKV